MNEKENDWTDWAQIEEEEYLEKLRDKAALLAMGKLLKHFDFQQYNDDPLRLARWSYDVADGMLRARKEKDEESARKLITQEQKLKLVDALGAVFEKELKKYETKEDGNL